MAAANPLILLTGATGFVGRQTLRGLLAQNATVRLVVRNQGQDFPSRHKSIEKLITTPDMFAEDANWWESTCKDIDTVIHVAWYAEPGQYLQSPKNLECLTGTLELAKGAIRAGVRRFVGVGTCFEYDLTGGLLSTDTPLRPLTPYASAKAAAFMALSQCLPSQGIEFAWCRLFYMYGEGEDARRLVPYLRERLAAGQPVELSSGTQVRDFMDVHKAAEMIVETALSELQGSINICSGVPITVRQMAEKIADEYGRRDLLKFGARPDNPFDPACVIGIPYQELQ